VGDRSRRRCEIVGLLAAYGYRFANPRIRELASEIIHYSFFSPPFQISTEFHYLRSGCPNVEEGSEQKESIDSSTIAVQHLEYGYRTVDSRMRVHFRVSRGGPPHRRDTFIAFLPLSERVSRRMLEWAAISAS